LFRGLGMPVMGRHRLTLGRYFLRSFLHWLLKREVAPVTRRH
jgi:hypothetical protein